MELDRIFDQRRTSAISVDEVFVDRVHHIAAFDDAAREMRCSSLPAVSAPPQRRNVLAFYGLGGIGKTRLSKWLERRFRDGDHDGAEVVRLACRINLDDQAMTELETLVLALRVALGKQIRRWPAFDLALAAYWERGHPGQPMAVVIERNSALKRLNESLGLPGQLDETLDALLGPVPIAGLARRATTALVTRIRDRISRDRLLADCGGFAEVLGTEAPQEMLPFLPALLSWDLAQHRREQDIDVVVFVDTFERVDEQRREPGGVEDQLVRMMYLLPNVLFVVTGRNRLTWGDRHHGAIHYSGTNYWPALAADPPAPFSSMQQQLSGLTAADADTYLRLRLTRDGEAAIPAEVREKIVGASGGVPLYLELSAEYFDQLSAGGQAPRPEEFGGTFTEMVVRVMRDLPIEERSLLRASSLVDRFDAALLRAALPDVRDAAIDRFHSRPIVQHEESGWLRESVDEYIRTAVRTHDSDTDDAWSRDEWRAAAGRMVADLHGRLRPDAEDPTRADRARLIQGFTTAGMLSQVTGEVPDWLYDLAYGLRIHHYTQALTATGSWAVPAGHPLEAFTTTCQGMALRNVGDRAGSARLLERACAHPALSTYARLFVMHRLAKALEETGRYADAERLVAQVAAEPSPLRETAEKDQAWIGWIRGDGRRLLAWSLPNRTSPIGFHRAQALDLLGQFQMIQGDLAEAERCYRCLIDDTELDAAGILRDTGWRHLGMVVSWSRPLDAEAILDRALQLNEELGVKVGVAQTYIWRAVARTGLRPAATVRQLIDHGESLLGSTGGSADQWMVLMARLFLVAVDGADSEARAAAEALIAHVREQDCHPGLGEVAARWLAVRGVEVPPPATVEYWLDRDASLASWEGVLRERRDTRRR